MAGLRRPLPCRCRRGWFEVAACDLLPEADGTPQTTQRTAALARRARRTTPGGLSRRRPRLVRLVRRPSAVGTAGAPQGRRILVSACAYPPTPAGPASIGCVHWLGASPRPPPPRSSPKLGRRLRLSGAAEAARPARQLADAGRLKSRTATCSRSTPLQRVL
ncbi:MAG: hypothetical protein IPK78_03660 [Rhodospirillales bacterium]|nr:hypothetical protein [Rhodospirillales bacterium]